MFIITIYTIRGIIFVYLSKGVSFDHIELNFYINGVCLDAPITGIRGVVYPAIYGKKVLYLSRSFWIRSRRGEFCNLM